MAKENNRPNSRGKMTVMMFQLEGDDRTLQQGLDTIRGAIDKMVPLRTAPLLPPPPNKHRDGGTPSPQQLLPLEDESQVEEMDTEENVGGVRTARPRPPEKAPEVLKEIDWETGGVPFKQFCEAKKPQGNPDRYVVIAVWFKKYRNTALIDRSYIYTCYGMMNWKKPGRLGDVFVNLQRRKGWFESRSGDMWEITLLGENRVDELPERAGG